MESLINKRLSAVKEDCDNAARNIFYALTFLPYTHPARANLMVALDSLGVGNPKMVGLSDKAGDYKS